MKVKIRKIGNSFGIILNKRILEEANVTDEVSLSVSGSQIIITPVKRNPRENWEEMLLQAGSLKDDEQFFEDLEDGFDQTDWTW